MSGITLQCNASKIFSVVSGLSYERKGTLITSTFFDQNGLTTGQAREHINFNYLDVPVLLRATFGTKVNFFLNAGPFFGYLLSEQETFNSGTSRTLPFYDHTSAFKRFDSGISFGAGIGIPIKNKILLSFELRNNTGLFNIDKPSPHYNNNPTIKTSSTDLLIGLAFKFGMKNAS